MQWLSDQINFEFFIECYKSGRGKSEGKSHKSGFWKKVKKTTEGRDWDPRDGGPGVVHCYMKDWIILR